MTVVHPDTASRSRGATRPRFASNVRPRKSEGAGNAGCALHPRSHAQRRCWLRARAYRAAEAIRHSLRNGFTAYNVLSPVTGLLPPSLAGLAAYLTPAPGRQDHTSLPYALAPFVIGTTSV